MSVFTIRHGETAWSISGQHTGVTDIPLTDKGRSEAERLRPVVTKTKFAAVFTSPLQRARDTCALVGLGDQAVVDPDLIEWNYGDYEGVTSDVIHQTVPHWQIFHDGAPGGETPEQVGARVDRIIARIRTIEGNVAVFSHGHLLRVFVARWIGLPPRAGENFLLDTSTLCVLDQYRGAPAIQTWNGPLP
jgi:broad specificity phosphatase PhoE